MGLRMCDEGLPTAEDLLGTRGQSTKCLAGTTGNVTNGLGCTFGKLTNRAVTDGLHGTTHGTADRRGGIAGKLTDLLGTAVLQPVSGPRSQISADANQSGPGDG